MSDNRTHAGPTTAGLVLGSYRILQELTSGGMGTVFRAEHVLLGRPAAIKLLRRDLSTSPALVQRFVNEAKAVTACKHPGIVEVYDFGYTDDGHAFIVMEFLDGESLGRRLARVALAEVEAAAIAHGIASALKAAHRVGVIHRDLKPDNVFLVPDPDGGLDRTKVLDFGIAKLADGASGTRNTETGSLIGTPLYMAPEQARAAAAIDHRADLYSLGCILYHMLTGRPPFLAEGAGEIIALQLFGDVEPPSRLAPVTPEMEQLVMRLLDKEPEARFASAGEVVNALTQLDRRPTSRMTRASEAVAAGSSGSQPGSSGGVAVWPGGSGTAPAPVASPSKRSALPRVAVAICALALVAVVVRYATHGDPSRGELSSPASLLEPAAPPPAVPAAPAVQVAPAAAPAPVAEAPAAPPPTAQAAATPPAPVIEPAVTPAPDDRGHKRPARKPPAGRGVGSITQPGARGLPEQAGGVHGGNREAASRASGEHTPGGAPMEDLVDIKPRGSGAHRPTPSPSKDLISP